ncbi:MAG: site-2 protease family protein [Ginsengibacter sp.]
MKGSIKIMKIKGVTLKLHWSFAIILVWIIAANAVQGFTWQNIQWSLIFVALIFLSVIIHDLAHYWVAKRQGVQAREINLLPVGGIPANESLAGSKKSEILISLAGPVANLAIAGLLLPFIQDQLPVWAIPSHFDIIHGSDILYKLHLVNLGLFFINLIPAFPLAGGTIFRTILSWKMDYFLATGIVATAGKVIAALFLVAGVIYVNFLLLVISLLIFSAVQTEESILELRKLIKGLTFENVITSDFSTLQSRSSIKDNIGNVMNDQSREFLVMEEGMPVGSIRRWDIINEASEKNYAVSIKEIVKNKIIAFDANEEVEKGFKSLLTFPYKNFPVIRNKGSVDGQSKKFAGVTSLMRIMEYLLLNRLDPKEHKILKSLVKKIG